MGMIDIDLRPDRRKLRQFGYLACLIFGVLSGWAYWRGHLIGIDLGDSAPTVSLTLAIVAVISVLFSVFWPTGNRLLHVVMTLVTWPIGAVVSHAIMLILFYLVITPLGLVFRLIGRDVLNRHPDPAAPSYWVEHSTPTSLERYFRQF